MFVTNPIGILGEDTAVEELEKQGFRILERNWRCGKLEVDIIAKDRKTIVFAEVKARTSTYGQINPEEYVDEGKRRRITAAANAYIRMHKIVDLEPRFDIFGVLVNRAKNEVVKCHHLPNAFRPSLRTISSSSFTGSWMWKKKRFK